MLASFVVLYSMYAIHGRIHASPRQYRSLYGRPTLCAILRARPLGQHAAPGLAAARACEALGLRPSALGQWKVQLRREAAGGRDPRIDGSEVGALPSAGQQETGNACGEMGDEEMKGERRRVLASFRTDLPLASEQTAAAGAPVPLDAGLTVTRSHRIAWHHGQTESEPEPLVGGPARCRGSWADGARCGATVSRLGAGQGRRGVDWLGRGRDPV